MNIQEEFEQITQKILDKLEVVCEKNKNKIPYTILENGNYNDLDYIDANPDLGISWWTNGFFCRDTLADVCRHRRREIHRNGKSTGGKAGQVF